MSQPLEDKEDKTAKIESRLASLWQRHLPNLRDRLDSLDRAAAEAASGHLTGPTRLEALAIAHKLSGSLGMFGHHTGTTLASEIEAALQTPTPEALQTLPTLIASLRNSLPL